MKTPYIKHYSPFEFNELTKGNKGEMRTDILRAKYSEEVVEEYLRVNGIYVIERDDKYTGKFDIKCSDGCSYEIKDESYNYDEKSGNIALEIGKLKTNLEVLSQDTLEYIYKNNLYQKSSLLISDSTFHMWNIKIQAKKIVPVQISTKRILNEIFPLRTRFSYTSNKTGDKRSFLALVKIKDFIENCDCFLDMSHSKWANDYLWDKEEILNILTEKERHD